MAQVSIGAMIRRLVRPLPHHRGQDDAILLARFVERGDQEAFEALLERHGPMVWRTCQRVVRQSVDAEDAFQATFLVLCRKAGSIGKRQSLAGWLHQVAHRIAVRANMQRAVHRLDETDQLSLETDPAAALHQSELKRFLDEALNCLPVKYRVPLILCYLEGKSRALAAAELGWAEGTLSSRLAHAKEALRAELLRRGFTLSAGAMTALLVETGSAQALPAALMATALKTKSWYLLGGAVGTGSLATRAAMLANGALKTMLLSKMKAVAAVVLMTLAVSGSAGLLLSQHANKSAAPPRAAEKDLPHAPAAPKAGPAIGKTIDSQLAKSLEEIERSASVSLYLGLAELQIKFGDKPAALVSCTKAAALAEAMKIPRQFPGKSGPGGKPYVPDPKLLQMHRDGAMQMIAPIQAAAGDVEGAIKITESLGTADKDGRIEFPNQGNYRAFALEEMASRLAREGRVAEAQRVASRMEQGRSFNRKDMALAEISLAQASQSDFPGALQTARAIQDAHTKVAALAGGWRWLSSFYIPLPWVGIAAYRAQQGDASGARKTIDEAVHILESVADQRQKASLEALIAAGQARIGETAAALKMATKIGDEAERKKAFIYIAVLLAKQKKWHEAFEIIDPIRAPEKWQGLAFIAFYQARAGDKKAAMATFDRTVKEIRGHEKSIDRGEFALGSVSSYQAEAGLFAEAVTTAELIEPRNGIDPSHSQLRNIAAIQALRGDALGALKLYESQSGRQSLGSDHWTIRVIASSLVAADREEDAQRLADSQGFVPLKSYALLGIAEGAIKRAENAVSIRAAKSDATRLSAHELQASWVALAGADAAQTYDAGLSLRSSPRSAVRFLRDRLRPGTPTAPAAPEQIARDLRAIELLGRINTSEARKLLQSLASGAGDTRLTEAAKVALARPLVAMDLPSP